MAMVGDIDSMPPLGDPERDPFLRLRPPPTGLPYRVRTLGHIAGDPSHSTLGTNFEDAMLMVFLDGRGTYWLKGEATAVSAGMVALILPGDDPGLLIADERHPYEHLQCRFAGDLALATARRIAAAHGGRRLFRFERWSEFAEVLLRGVTLWPGREWMPDPEERLRRVDAVLAEALACLDNPAVQRPKRLGAKAFMEYMHAHVGQPIDLERMATQFRVTKPHLCRLAKREFGQPLGQLWLRMKIDWARIMLRHGQMRIAEVARRVGYRDPLYFSRVFRRATGVSPTHWRRQATSSRH